MNSSHPRHDEIIDLEKAMARLGDDEHMLHELAGIFLQEYQGWLQEIDEAILNRDSSMLMRAAHTLKGSADVFGARGTVQAALRLEKMGREETFEDIDNAWATLKVEMVWLRQALEDLISPETSPYQEISPG